MGKPGYAVTFRNSLVYDSETGVYYIMAVWTVMIYVTISPSMELTLSRWGGLSTEKFQPDCVNEDSSTERRN